MNPNSTTHPPTHTSAPAHEENKPTTFPRCGSCKHWGGQGTSFTITENQPGDKTCMAYLFGDSYNDNFVEMPQWTVTYGRLNGAKGALQTNEDFGCINHNPTFEG